MNSLDIAKPMSRTRIVVAMSGGVDSSVVACLLKTEGYDVVGVTLRLYDDGAARGRPGACCAGRDIGDARAVAAKLRIPHYVLDYQSRFRTAVIDPFAAAYARGETPIPCSACNVTVKFTDLLSTARDLGADALVTGHYGATRRLPYGGRGLFRAADATRDQSYFLAGITRAQLDFVRFPLGDMPKSRVREMARTHGLGVAEKPDSQDICFVPTGRYSDLVARLVPEASAPGDIVDVDGRVLGRHEGIIHYTIGQRKGLGLGGAPEPLFVVRIDPAEARVVVGPRAALRVTRLDLDKLNWLGDGPLEDLPGDGLDLYVRTRSTRPPVAARLFRSDDAAWIVFPDNETAVAPGQTCALYESDDIRSRVLGGGTVTVGGPTLANTPAAGDAAVALAR